MNQDNESVGRHVVKIDELGRISYATITAVPEPGVVLVLQSNQEIQALKSVGVGNRYDSCNWTLGEWLLDSWWPSKAHSYWHCIK